MATTVQELRVISPSELDQVLDQARAESWRELALIGPQAPGWWPVRAMRAFRLHEPLGVQLAKLATLAQLTELDLSGNRIGADGVRALSALVQLTELDLSRNQIGDDGAPALAAFAGLTCLTLIENAIGDDGARALAALAQLTDLHLGGNQVSDDGARALTALTRLTELHLDYNSIGPDGARALTALTQLTKLHLSRNQIGRDGARALAALTQLTELDLSRNQIGDDGARALAALTEITELELNYNQIGDDGARALAALARLSSLNLEVNGIGADGARALAALTRLTELSLEDNEIGADGARALTALTRLTKLNLSYNKISNDGACALAALTQLTKLNLANNGIDDDGACALAALTQLTALDLSYNEIDVDGARSLGALTRLTELNLEDNQIDDDGACALAALTQLTSLNLKNNQIGADGARALAVLTQLTKLDLSYNQIGDDGARALAALARLTKLGLSLNGIETEGAHALAALTQLTELTLNANRIDDDGARALSALTQLIRLDLSHNQIGADGARALAALTQLTELDLSHNQIGADGARALAALTQLTELDLSRNQIGADGARALAALTQLTSLSLENNQIDDDGARALAALTQLSRLDVSHNQIAPDGTRALAALTQLTSLNLSANQIGDVGARALAALTQLTSLNLSANQIGDVGARALLDSLSEPIRSSRLNQLFLRGNQIAASLLTAEVLASGDAQAILAGYRRYRNNEQQATLRPLNEAKLIVLGNEAVGKTSLIRYLVEDHARDPDEAKTSGAKIHEQIEIQTWSTHHSPVRLNVWDFGGQEIMRGTHRFFLTARSLYLLVLEDRREDDRSIYDWLETIAQCGGESPVIVVINKTDRESPQRVIDEDALHRSHPAIVGFARTSCNADARSATSIARLRELILATLIASPLLRHVRDPIPQSWLRVKDAIRAEANRQFVLPVRDFQRLCEGATDAPDGERITDLDEQRAALLLLHDLGIVIAHGARDNARAAWREVSILDPNWLTQAIYSLLTSHVVRDQQGELRRAQLGTLLDPERYPARWHELILGMMQDSALGLCLPISRGDAERYLLPEALPPAEPDYGIWPEDSLRFRFQYERLPAGLIPRLIVEAHRSLTHRPTYWRTGVVLACDGCTVLVRGEIGKDRVEIHVAGASNRRSALSVVRGYFDAVHRQYARLKVHAKVPLPEQPEVDAGYDHLVQLERDDGPDYPWRPEGAHRKYTVRELLEGVRDDDAYRRSRPSRTSSDPALADAADGLAAPAVPVRRSSYHGRIDFGIVTIREDENEAVLRRFDKHAVEVQQRRYRIRRLELPGGGAYTLAVLRSLEQGNTDSLMAARDLLDDLSPRFVLVVGIAGGAPSSEFSLGDVVISSRIVDTSVEAVKDGGVRTYAHGGGPLDPEAAGLAADIKAMIADGELDGWNTDAAIGKPRPPVDLSPSKFYGSKASKAALRAHLERHFGGTPRAPLAVTGAISSSDRLIKDTAILARWQESARQVIAVEMESAGVYKATHGRVPFLAIRGISDVVGYERHPDWTAYACETAAAFTRAFLLAEPTKPIAAR